MLLDRFFFRQGHASPPPPPDPGKRLRDEWEREQVTQRVRLLDREAALLQRRQYNEDQLEY